MPGIDYGIGRTYVTGTGVLRTFSRRRLLHGAAAWAVAYTVARAAPIHSPSPRRAKLLAYVGAYTEAVGSGDTGEGIYLFEMDQAASELKLRGTSL
jgi:hypothetical protein